MIGPVPPGFGAELHLNVSFAAAGRRIHVVDVGRYRGPIRDKVEGSAEFAAAIFDHAERLGRLDAAARPAWEDWVTRVGAVIRTWMEVDSTDDAQVADFNARVAAVASRPLPSA